MGALDVVAGDVLPWIATVFSAVLFFTPLQLIASIRRTKHTGPVNYLPFVMMYFQSLMWVIYGFFISNVKIVPVNVLGTTIGLYSTLVFYGNSRDDAVRLRIEIGMTATSLFAVIMATSLFFSSLSNDSASFVFGLITNVICMLFYTSPLSTLYTIVRIRDASSLSLPMSVMIVLNGTAWFFYGWYVQNKFIWIPNGVATILGLIQLTILCCVGSKAKRGETPFLPVVSDEPTPTTSEPPSAVITSSPRLGGTGTGIGSGSATGTSGSIASGNGHNSAHLAIGSKPDAGVGVVVNGSVAASNH